MINYHKFTLNMGKWKITAEVTSVNFGFSQLCYQHKQLRTKPKKISLDTGFEAGTLLYQYPCYMLYPPSYQATWIDPSGFIVYTIAEHYTCITRSRVVGCCERPWENEIRSNSH